MSEESLQQQITLLSQKFDVVMGEINAILASAEKTVGLLTKGTAEGLKSLKLEAMQVDSALEHFLARLETVENKLEGLTKHGEGGGEIG